MSIFRQLRGQREQKRATVTVGDSPAFTSTGNNTSYRESLNGFLAQRRSLTPSLINFDKISMAQNLAGAIYLPIAFAATQLSRAKIVIYEHTRDPRDPDGRKRIPRYDPIYDLFRNPNPSDTLRNVLYSLSQQYDVCGECYCWLPSEDAYGQISDHGEPREMYVIPSAWISGLPSCPWWEGGCYQVTPYVSQYPGGTQSAFIPAEQMIRIYDPHPLFDKTAFSVLQAISQTVDTVRSIDQGRSSAQKNGCHMSLAFELDPQLVTLGQVDVKRTKEVFQQINAGELNAGRPMFLPPGVKPVPISGKPDEQAWVEGWQQLTDFTFACYQTNRAALGMSGDLNFATLYASIKQVYWSKLEPRLEAFGQSFDKFYFDPFLGPDYFCEFELPRMDDEQQKLAGLKLDLEAGAITKGQYLRERGYEVDPETTPNLDQIIGVAASSQKPERDERDEPVKDENAEGDRPRNELGGGPLGNRIDAEKLFAVLDRQLVRGTIRNGKH